MSESWQPTSAREEPLLRVAALDSGHEGLHTVRGVTFEVGRGETVALLGPNGAGKTTLLATVAGLLPPFGGQVCFDGEDLTGAGIDRILAAGIAYVPQVGNVFPSLTVLDTLAISYRGPDFDSALDEVLELFPRLKQKLRTRAGLMSGGERQMVAIARAMIRRPFSLLMLDEPSAGLSTGNVRAIFEKITWVHEQGIAVLLVEQNATKALQICDRGYVMENGEIAFEGSKEELLSSTRVREHYLGVR